ncbi:MAG: tRNA pseudouridine(55) synthase TruB [Desulfuromonadaceae bacterium]|nr:tRNA pseudouridine(55) synthase TruB [Desulfuromonadaceae bacterium]
MNGFLLIDKPQGITSHAVVQKVRRACKIRRVGHAGTLDPLATGLLLVAVGQATRLVEYLMAEDKRYRTTLRFGLVTDSQDITGEVVAEHSVPDFSLGQLETVCQRFVGEIDQVPPMFSALKKNGVPLYRLARRGEEVERQKRRITIHAIDLLSIDGAEVTLDVHCSKGTYIRTLCHDIGQALGCGGCMTALRRLSSGLFDSSQLISLDQLEAGSFNLLSPLDGFVGYPRLDVDEAGISRLREGIPPRLEQVSGALPQQGEPLLLTAAGHLLAIAVADTLHQREQRGDFKLLKVFPEGI